MTSQTKWTLKYQAPVEATENPEELHAKFDCKAKTQLQQFEKKFTQMEIVNWPTGLKPLKCRTYILLDNKVSVQMSNQDLTFM